LPLDEIPVNRARQHGLQVWIRIGSARFGPVELLRVEGFESRQQMKAEQPAKGKGHFTLAVAVHIIFLDFHLGAMP
jgi:hypothetical protein